MCFLCRVGACGIFVFHDRAGARVPFHWPNRDQDKRIQITFYGKDWDWSGGVDPGMVGTTALRLKNLNIAISKALARDFARGERNCLRKRKYASEQTQF